MARKDINTGNYPNDPNADTIKQAMDKIHQMFKGDVYPDIDELRNTVAEGIEPYELKSQLPSSVGADDPKIAVVFNDTADNNGWYRWDSGTNAWVKRDEFYATDPSTTDDTVTSKATAPIWVRDYLNSRTVDTVDPTDTSDPVVGKAIGDYVGDLLLHDGSEVAVALADEDGYVAAYVSTSGVMHMRESQTLIPNSYAKLVNQVLEIDDSLEELLYILDSEGYVISYMDSKGFHHIGELENITSYLSSYEIDGSSENDPIPAPLRPQSENKSKGILHNQWIYPLMAEYKGELFGGGTGFGLQDERTGGVYCTQRKFHSHFELRRLRDVTESSTYDDHNAPSVLLDIRDDAEYPLMVFQNDHNENDYHFWRSSKLDAAYLQDETVLPYVSGATYSQTHRNPNNPDEIIAIHRGGNPDSWQFKRSLDNGETWDNREVFSSGDMDYLLTKEAIDGSGLHIIHHMHPQNTDVAGQQRLFYSFYSWGGAITSPALGSPLNSDIWDGEMTTINPFDAGLSVIRTPATDLSTRLFDHFEVENGTIEFVWVEFPYKDNNDFEGVDTEYRHGRYDYVNDTILHDEQVVDAGWPIQMYSSNGYFAGISVMDSGKVIVAKWQPLNDTKASHDDHKGTGTISVYERTGTDAWQEEVIEQVDDVKLFRPVSVPKFYSENDIKKVRLGNYYTYLKGKYYHWKGGANEQGNSTLILKEID